MLKRLPALTGKVARYSREVSAYARQASTPSDFVRTMQVRLSQSKVGPLVCPRPTIVDVDLRSLGPEVRLRSHTTDISVLGELLVSNGYGALSSAVRGDVRTIVDLGANTGLTARWFGAQWPRAKIVCVEPEPGNVAILRHNAAQMASPAVVVPACVGGWERRVRLTTSGGEFAYAMSETDASAQDGTALIDVVTLEHVLAAGQMVDEPIDILKCDVEGAEAELFADCSSWIGRVRTAIVECHNDYRVHDLLNDLDANGAVFDIVDFVPNRGFECEVAILARRR